MATIDKIHDYILRIIDAPHGDVMVRHEDIDALFNAEQHALMAELMGGRMPASLPMSSDDASLWQHHALAPLMRTMQLNNNAYDGTSNPGGTEGGFIAFDHGAAFVDAIVVADHSGRHRNVKIMGWHRYGAVDASYLGEPTPGAGAVERFAFPVGDLQAIGGSSWPAAPGYRLVPEEGVTGWLTYYESPREVLYSYTVSGRTVTYDPAASVHPQWPDDVVYKVLVPRVLAKLGVQLDSVALVQYGEQKGQT